MIDSGETDTKLIKVHADDYRLDSINKLEELPEPFLKDMPKHFLTTTN